MELTAANWKKSVNGAKRDCFVSFFLIKTRISWSEHREESFSILMVTSIKSSGILNLPFVAAKNSLIIVDPSNASTCKM